MLISLASLLGGILNSLDRFWVNAAAPILLNISMIVALWFFHGHDPYQTARAQAISVTVGGVLQLGWLMLACRPDRGEYRIRRPGIDDDLRAAETHFAGSHRRRRGSGEPRRVHCPCRRLLDPGSISYIYYADRLNQLPLGTDRYRPWDHPVADRLAAARAQKRD